MTNSHYLVKISAACMPTSCDGRYVRVGLLEVDPGIEHVSMISDRAKGVRNVVATWESLYSGLTDRDAHSRALEEAWALADHLNAGGKWDHAFSTTTARYGVFHRA